MAVTAKAYGLFLKSLLNKEIDFDSDDIRIMLVTAGHTPDQDTHQYKNQVTNEVSGTGYTAGGVALASKTVTYTSGTNTITLDCADPSWSTATITARYGIIYDNTPSTDATRPLLGYIDFGADVSSTAGTFQITIDSAGLMTLTAA